MGTLFWINLKKDKEMITKVKFVLSMLLMAAMPSARVMADGIAINAADSPDETFHNYQLSQDYGQDGKLTEEEAVCKAMNFFSRSVAVGTGMKKAPRKSPSLIVACIRDEFYIFNDEANGGYVIVSCDERQPYTFGRVYGYCVFSIFLFHVLINIGMVLGLMPVIGIPLPFFSYGGSSLWGFTLLLFIFLGIDAGRVRYQR